MRESSGWSPFKAKIRKVSLVMWKGALPGAGIPYLRIQVSRQSESRARGFSSTGA
ncbi:MAG: hypothetical protein ACE5QF_06060 [Thermoplasmata archaeon]